MSNVCAFRCDVCNSIKEFDEIVGVMPVADLFDDMKSYPPIFKNLHKTDYHYCSDCYREKVLVPAANGSNRKTDEPGYKAKLLDFSYILRRSTVHKDQNKN